MMVVVVAKDGVGGRDRSGHHGLWPVPVAHQVGGLDVEDHGAEDEADDE